MSAQTASPRRCVIFPPEILLRIISIAFNLYPGEYSPHLRTRNAQLARLALVSRAFRAATYSVLYGDLRLAWMGDTFRMLQRSFKENSHLLPLVRRLEAIAVHKDDWVDDKWEAHCADQQSKDDWLDAYCAREGIKKNSFEWRDLWESPLDATDAGEEYEAEMRKEAAEAWDTEGHGT